MKIRLSKILFNFCFIALVVFLLAGNADTANAGCCVPVSNPAGNCFLPTIINETEVCSSGVYHSESCSSVSACNAGGGTGEPSGSGASGVAGGGEKCKPGFTEYSGVCFPDDTGLSDTPIKEIVVNVMQWILGIFGFIALIAFAISGIQYMTAAGSENAIETAKRNMKWSIVGVIVGLGGLVIIWAVDSLLFARHYI